MDCGIDVVNDLLSYMGLAKPEIGTPSTVELDRDETENAARDAAIMAASKQLSYGICLPTECSPVTDGNDLAKKEFKFSGCNPQNCRMTSGICIDCTYCHAHCTCDKSIDKEETVSPNRLSVQNQQGLFINAICGNSTHTATSPERTTIKPQQLLLRKSPSLMSDDSSDSDGIGYDNNRKTRSKTPSPSKSFILKNNKKGGTNTRRYDMGDDGAAPLHLTDRLLKEHTNRSNRSYRSNESSRSGSHHSYMSYNSSKTGSSSRRRYNMGDEDEIIYQEIGHSSNLSRRSANSNTRSSRRSNTSFSLLRGKKKNNSLSTLSSTKKNVNNDPIIGKTFSFDSGNSYSSGMGSAYSADHTRGSATTARRRNSRTGGGSLSSSSRSYLDGSDVEQAAAEPKKSWFRRRLESKE